MGLFDPNIEAINDMHYEDSRQATAYREIAASLGMEGKPVDEVVGRVKELSEAEISRDEFNCEFTCPRCSGHYFGSKIDPQTDKIVSRHCHDEFGRGCHWSGSDAECGLAPKGD